MGYKSTPCLNWFFNYSQQEQGHSQPVPTHSSPQVHASSHAPLEQQEVVHAPLQLDELLLFNAYNTLEPAITTKVANKITFFFMIYFFKILIVQTN
jgi:hypothetical protein